MTKEDLELLQDVCKIYGITIEDVPAGQGGLFLKDGGCEKKVVAHTLMEILYSDKSCNLIYKEKFVNYKGPENVCNDNYKTCFTNYPKSDNYCPEIKNKNSYNGKKLYTQKCNDNFLMTA